MLIIFEPLESQCIQCSNKCMSKENPSSWHDSPQMRKEENIEKIAWLASQTMTVHQLGMTCDIIGSFNLGLQYQVC